MNPLNSPARRPRHRTAMLLAGGRPRHAFQGHRPTGHLMHSTFALEQLTRLARHCPEPEFVMLLATVFGLDIAPQTYLNLQAALREGQIRAPQCHIVHDGFYPAEYDTHTRTMRIHSAALDYVQAHPQVTWELLEILLHEFGHHLDTLLREDLSAGAPPLSRDAISEEGTRYVKRMAATGWDGPQQITVARYMNAAGQPVTLEVEPRKALHRMLSCRATQGNHGQSPSAAHRESFEATGEEDGKFSHERIENILLELGFSENECQKVYFGNWLRDHSQVLDPKLVRGKNMKKNFPQVLSRDTLIVVVDILASRHFAEPRLEDKGSFLVTLTRLGVYRPSEHIDNPRVEAADTFDLAERDPDFEPWVVTGDALLQVDPDTSMKRYIQRSVEFMQGQLREAMQQGRTTDGLHSLGSALHVLEDLFAHSNFVELGLIKLGHAVLPWTSEADCRHKLPLVTGRFAGADIIASLAQPLAQLIAPSESWQFSLSQPGERTANERMTQVLLREHHNPALLEGYEKWLEFCDELRATEAYPYIKLLSWIKLSPLRLLSNAWNELQSSLLTLVGNSVDEAQTWLGGDPNKDGSTDPSHSQLAKDHADHPLHEPAGLLASQASARVAKAMLDHWNSRPGEDPLAIAASYFTHPYDADWQDRLLSDWAEQHPEGIKQAGSLKDLKKLQDQILNASRQALNTLTSESRKTWDYIQDLFETWLIKLAETQNPGNLPWIDVRP